MNQVKVPTGQVPGYLTVREAAQKLNVQWKRVGHWCATGRLYAVKIADVWLIPEESLERFQVPQEGLDYEGVRRPKGDPPKSRRQRHRAPNANGSRRSSARKKVS